MKKVFVLANTKGGVGKSTIAIHVLSAVFPGCDILEIDDNNRSNIFKESAFINKFESIKVNECEDRLEELTFDLITDTDKVLVIDCGGGNDTKAVLAQIKNLELDKISDLTYIIPIMNSLMQTKNAMEMAKFLSDQKLIFALNGVHNEKNFRKEWSFWHGHKALGIDSFYEKLGKPKSIIIPHSPIFELATLFRQTISDFAILANTMTMDDYRESISHLATKEKKPIYLKEHNKYTRSKVAKKFLDSFIYKIEFELTQGEENV